MILRLTLDQVALVATNSLLSSQLIVGIISVLHEVRDCTHTPATMLTWYAELCPATLASIPYIHWTDRWLLHHQCFHELNFASHLPWCL